MPQVARGCWACAGLCCVLLAAETLQAQTVRVRGQIFLPDGQPIGEVTRFTLASEESPRGPEYHYTDSQGRLNLPGLAPNTWYTITVETDGQTYATTTESFLAQALGYVAVHLRPLERQKGRAGPPTVSPAQLGHQPPREAQKAYEGALEAIERREFDSAKQKLRRALELDPNYVNPYNELAVLLMADKKYDEAELVLRRALEKDPEATHPLLNLGITLNHLGRYREAIEPLRKALKLRPHWAGAYVYLGIALLETDQAAEAEAYLLRGTQGKGREQALGYLYVGKLYAEKGDVKKTIAAWKSYLEVDPDSPNAARVRELLARLNWPPQKP